VENKRRKRRLWPWLIVLAVLIGLGVCNYWPAGPTKIIPSRETTYITGPLNPDGTPNYVKYLDDKYSADITPENNAAPLLLRALGPELLPGSWWDDYSGTIDLYPQAKETLRRLGLTEDVFKGDKHFIRWEDRVVPALADANGASPAATNGDEDEDDGPDFEDVYWDLHREGKVHPELAAWLAANAEPLEFIRQASKKERLYLPLISDSTPPQAIGARQVNLDSLREAVMALRVFAMLRMTRGDAAGAWRDVITIHRLARLFGQSPALLLHMLATSAEGRTAYTGMRFAVHHLEQTAPLARDILRDLGALGSETDVATRLEAERLMGLDAIMHFYRGFPVAGSGAGSPAKTFQVDADWNQMLREMNGWYDRAFAPVLMPAHEGREQAAEAFHDEIKALSDGAVASDDLPGRVMLLAYGGRLTRAERTRVVLQTLVALVIPNLSYRANRRDSDKTWCDLERVAVALAAYHAEKGRWPAKLTELRPSLLKEIPLDRFSGKPLIYKPREDGYLLYSVGMNMRDDGGPHDDDKPADDKSDDIGAQVPPANQGAQSQPAN